MLSATHSNGPASLVGCVLTRLAPMQREEWLTHDSFGVAFMRKPLLTPLATQMETSIEQILGRPIFVRSV
jgi:hypothetical protein